jgi:hypothetical protein
MIQNILCFFEFHNFHPWSSNQDRKVQSNISGEIFDAIIQDRYCKNCNKYKWRRI